MDSREQLLQTLMQDLQNFQMPERYSEEKKAQIMKGRRSQADIDEGRRTIAENERLFQEAHDKRKAIADQIQSLQGEIESAATKAKQDDPVNQAIQYGKSIGIPAAGYVGGHYLGKKFGERFDIDPQTRAAGAKKLADKLRGINRTSPTSKAEASAIVDTYDKNKRVRSPSQFLGPAALGGFSFATQAAADYAEDPYLKEGLNLAATAERTGAAGMGIQQLIDTLASGAKARQAVDPGDVADIEAARRINKGSRRFQGAMEPEAPAQPANTTQPASNTPSKPPTRPELFAEAKARGLPVTTKTKKADLEKLLGDALKKGSQKRLPKSTKMIGPLVAGAMAYDAATSEAEARGAGPVGQTASGAGAATAAGGATYGMQRLMSALGKAAPNAMRALGSGAAMAMPTEISSAMDAPPEQMNLARNKAARYLPEFMHAGAIGEAAEMAQVPERNPARFDDLIDAAERDPALAETLRAVIQERLAGPQYP